MASDRGALRVASELGPRKRRFELPTNRTPRRSARRPRRRQATTESGWSRIPRRSSCQTVRLTSP